MGATAVRALEMIRFGPVWARGGSIPEKNPRLKERGHQQTGGDPAPLELKTNQETTKAERR